MKNIALFFLLVFCSVSKGQTLTTFSGHLFDVQWSGKSFNKEATDQIALKNKANKIGVQRLLDEAGTGAELLWKANGPLEQIYKEIRGSNISWIWADAVPGQVSLVVTLNLDGSGYIDLFQAQNLVGHVLCRSSNFRNKVGGQPKEGKTRVWRKSAGYVNGAGVKMPNSMFIDNPERMLAMHAGNRLTVPGGCVRMGIYSSEQLFRLVEVGTEVTIVYKP